MSFGSGRQQFGSIMRSSSSQVGSTYMSDVRMSSLSDFDSIAPRQRSYPLRMQEAPARTQRAKEELNLSDEQLSVVQAVRDGKSVFFTGCAGTGKSRVLQAIINSVSSSGLYITASTGLAAVNIGGCTLHSFAGVGRANGTLDELVAFVRRSRNSCNRWEQCRLLIIDEISMLDGDLFDKLEHVARIIRENDQPFGGIQLALCGDFLQLPPVPDRGQPIKFCFEASSFRRCVPLCIELRRVFRQHESTFVRMLAELRMGIVGDEALTELRSRVRRPLNNLPDGMEPTRLYPLRRDVDSENTHHLSALGEESRTFTAVDKGEAGPVEALQRNCLAPARLVLKIKAQVMLVRNVDPVSGLVNGSRGVVIGFEDDIDDPGDKWPLVRFVQSDRGTDDFIDRLIKPESFETEQAGRVVASRSQVPLTLAWALTVHKCQGMTLDSAVISFRSVFECGQGYVALSRLRDIESLSIADDGPGDLPWAKIFRAHPRALEFYKNLSQSAIVKYSSSCEQQKAEPQSTLNSMVDHHVRIVPKSQVPFVPPRPIEPPKVVEVTQPRAAFASALNTSSSASTKKEFTGFTSAADLLPPAKVINTMSSDVIDLTDDIDVLPSSNAPFSAPSPSPTASLFEDIEVVHIVDEDFESSTQTVSKYKRRKREVGQPSITSFMSKQ